MEEEYTGPRPVLGLGYQIEGGGSSHYPKIYAQWYKMLERFIQNDPGFNTLHLAVSWECFDNFRDWFIKEEEGKNKLKSRYITFNAPEFLPRRMQVGEEVQMIVSPRYGPKTCRLVIKKPPTWRKQYWKEDRVRNKESEEMEDVMVLREGTRAAQQIMFFVPVDTKLYRRKKAAVRARSDYLRLRDEETERTWREKAKTRSAKDVVRIGKANAMRGVSAHYTTVILPAQELQLKQLAGAREAEALRLVGLDDIELRANQKGMFAGLGYIGEGKYRPRINGKKTRAYEKWIGLIVQCYKRPEYRDDGNPYQGYRLGKKFMCFQDFAKWFEKHDRDGSNLPTFIVRPNSKNKLVLGPKNTQLMF